MNTKFPTPYLIAEIGINHNGDMEIAKKLILEASKAGFNAVKFQKRTVADVYSKEFLDSPRESPWGKTQRDQKNGIEFDQNQYQEIDLYCKELKIDWFASPWDLKSVDFLENLDCKYYKIASPMLTNSPLVKKIASLGKKTFISTGMSSLEEIDAVVEIFNTNKCPYELMHCVSTYPMESSDANLLSIPFLKSRYNVDVGWSGHEKSLVTISLLAASLGATSIERHITLDRTMYGSDQAASIEVKNAKSFVEAILSVALSMGAYDKQINKKEIPIKEKLQIKL